MVSSAQGERVDGRSRFKAYIKRKITKHDRTQDSPGPLSNAEASPARSEISSIRPATSQETNGAINTATNTATNGKPIEPRTDATEESVKSENEKIDESDLWSRAYQNLDEKTKKWIKDASEKESGDARSQELITLVREREQKYKDETPKLRIGHYEVRWRDYANRVVTLVTIIGNISISFAPAPSPVVWPALKVLLKVRRYITLNLFLLIVKSLIRQTCANARTSSPSLDVLRKCYGLLGMAGYTKMYISVAAFVIRRQKIYRMQLLTYTRHRWSS